MKGNMTGEKGSHTIYLQMVTAIRTTCKKGKKEWDGNNSSGGGDKREGGGKKFFFKWGVGRDWGCWSESYIAVVVLVGAAECYMLIAIRKY